MQDFPYMLNQMLTEVYHNIMRLEEEFLQNNNRINLTIREMHLIECVGMGRENGKSVSEIADYLQVARPSVTVAVSKLEKKGYLIRQGCDTDGRIVRVHLTRAGRKVDYYHKQYHLNMVREIENEFQPDEKEYLLRTIVKLNEFFKKSMGVIA